MSLSVLLLRGAEMCILKAPRDVSFRHFLLLRLEILISMIGRLFVYIISQQVFKSSGKNEFEEINHIGDLSKERILFPDRNNSYPKYQWLAREMLVRMPSRDNNTRVQY